MVHRRSLVVESRASSLAVVHELSPVAEWGLFSSCGVRASYCGGSPHCGASSQLLLSMWILPGPGIKPMSPALAGRVLATGLPGKSLGFFLIPLT